MKKIIALLLVCMTIAFATTAEATTKKICHQVVAHKKVVTQCKNVKLHKTYIAKKIPVKTIKHD